MILKIDYDQVPVDLSDYLRPLPMPPGGYPDGKCQRCGRTVPPGTNRNKVKRIYCCELCLTRARRHILLTLEAELKKAKEGT